MYNKNNVCRSSPMGWNSYDYYNTAVNEEQVKANAGGLQASCRLCAWLGPEVWNPHYARNPPNRSAFALQNP